MYVHIDANVMRTCFAQNVRRDRVISSVFLKLVKFFGVFECMNVCMHVCICACVYACVCVRV